MQWNEAFFNFLISCFEVGHLSRTLPELKQLFQYPHDAETLRKSGFSYDGICQMVEIDPDDWREVELTEEGQYAYFDRGWVELQDEEIQLYQFDLRWFPGQLRTRLHLGGKQNEILPETLWHLGVHKTSFSETLIWLCRHLDRDEYDAIYEFFASYPGKREGILLSQSCPVYKNARLPGDFTLIRIDELMNEQGHLSLNRFINGQGGTEEDLVYWDKNRKLLYVKGKEPIRFSGTMQSMAIELMYERCLDKDNKWNIQALLEKIGSNSSHINKLFYRNKRWREVVTYADGMCWLIIPEK